MSAEILRQAAAEIRDDWNGDGRGGHLDFLLAVADWLDATAERIDLGKPGGPSRRGGNHGWRGTKQALAVARAYLGESA